MDKKLDLKSLILTIFNVIICLILIIFKSPEKVPLFFDFSEKIAVLGSKWFLLTCAIIPTILGIFISLTLKKPNLNFFLKMLFYICIYENMLILIYVSTTDVFMIGAKSEIPMSLVYFLPLSACMMLGGLKLKNLPYKSFSPFKNKLSTKSDVIWKQTHILASKLMFAIGFVMVVATMLFAILKLFIINLITIILAIIAIYIFVLRDSWLMNKKIAEMQAKKDKLDSEKKSSEENKNTQ
ncbi:MAG: SdpI family protein [Clostridia bacterium]|nr:SdpI family protein [Clostridia bacterium]